MFEGFWDHDKFGHYGRLIFVDGDAYVSYKIKKKKQEGEFKNEQFEGNGIYYYNNNTRYEGMWRNNKKVQFSLKK